MKASEKFNFEEMAVVAMSNFPDCPGNCDADGSEGSGCDCDSPN